MKTPRVVVVMLCLALVGAFAPQTTAHAATNQIGTYTAVKATRLLDTRSKLPLGARQSLTVAIAGRATVPSTGVAAVVVNLTAVSATAAGYLALYPTGQPRPNPGSTLNFVKGVTRANMATVPLGTGTSAGKISVYNSSSSVDVLVDILGYYADGASTATLGSEFAPVEPDRLADTRDDKEGPVAPQSELYLQVDFNQSTQDNNSTVKALAVNVTAVGAKSAGFLSAYDGTSARPNTSTVNFSNSSATPNMSLVQTSRCRGCDMSDPVLFAVYNGSKDSVHIIVDLVGVYYKDGTVGLRFAKVAPQRISDSRTNFNASPLGPGATQSRSGSAVTTTKTQALLGNTTAIRPTASTHFVLWQAGAPRPLVSNVNATAGSTVANATILPLSSSKNFAIYNARGTANYAIDVTGRFDQGVGFLSSLSTARARPHSFDSFTSSSDRSGR